MVKNKLPSKEKVGKYLKQSEEYGLFPFFLLELSSGLRRGELIALLWSDLDVEKCTISVTKAVSGSGPRMVVGNPKTVDARRKVVIPQRTVDALIREHEKHPDNPYMFPSPKTGKMLDTRDVWQIHRILLKQAGFEQEEQFYSLRHVFTLVLEYHAVDRKIRNTMLGNGSSRFICDMYGHVTDSMQWQAAEVMAGYLQQII